MHAAPVGDTLRRDAQNTMKTKEEIAQTAAGDILAMNYPPGDATENVAAIILTAGREIAALEVAKTGAVEALAEAGIILEALHLAVKWELADDIKAEIARVVALIPTALAALRTINPSAP